MGCEISLELGQGKCFGLRHCLAVNSKRPCGGVNGLGYQAVVSNKQLIGRRYGIIQQVGLGFHIPGPVVQHHHISMLAKQLVRVWGVLWGLRHAQQGHIAGQVVGKHHLCTQAKANTGQGSFFQK